MHLLFKREQSSSPFTLVPLQIGGGVMFKLWARAELDDEERELLNRYHFRNALLIADEWGQTLRRSLRTATFLGVIIFIVVLALGGLQWAIWTTLVAVIAITAFYYNELRENIYVRDLVHGRTFRCFSIVELIRKEAYLETLATYLRQVLESAKNWGDRESIEIPALDREAAKELVIRGTGWRSPRASTRS